MFLSSGTISQSNSSLRSPYLQTSQLGEVQGVESPIKMKKLKLKSIRLRKIFLSTERTLPRDTKKTHMCFPQTPKAALQAFGTDRDLGFPRCHKETQFLIGGWEQLKDGVLQAELLILNISSSAFQLYQKQFFVFNSQQFTISLSSSTTVAPHPPPKKPF